MSVKPMPRRMASPGNVAGPVTSLERIASYHGVTQQVARLHHWPQARFPGSVALQFGPRCDESAHDFGQELVGEAVRQPQERVVAPGNVHRTARDRLDPVTQRDLGE